MRESLIFAHFLFFVSELLILLKSNERCERIAHFAYQKWATMSDLLRSLRGNEQYGKSLILLTKHKRMSESLIFLRKIAHSLIFGQKTSDLLKNQMREFPALLICSFTQIAQIKWATVSDLLISLKTNERLWANCSCRSYQKSDLLRLLVINERFT